MAVVATTIHDLGAAMIQENLVDEREHRNSREEV